MRAEASTLAGLTALLRYGKFCWEQDCPATRLYDIYQKRLHEANARLQRFPQVL
jgi:hypothetical protein